jgi:hypothetical protein
MIFEYANSINMNPRRQIVEYGAISITRKMIFTVGKNKEIVEKKSAG